jgi:hypothetical protein
MPFALQVLTTCSLLAFAQLGALLASQAFDDGRFWPVPYAVYVFAPALVLLGIVLVRVLRWHQVALWTGFILSIGITATIFGCAGGSPRCINMLPVLAFWSVVPWAIATVWGAYLVRRDARWRSAPQIYR